jgi:F-type H+-transporting ATPase subunit b
MDLVGDIGSILLFAQETAGEGGGGEEEGGSFLVSPELGLMIWTLLLFGATLLILNKLVFPRISEALDKRSKAIAESIESAERTKREADELLEEYRARLREAREQSEDIVVRARKAADSLADQAKADASKQREELLAAARRDIEAETRRALDEIRKEVADLTVIATEKVTRKSLTPDDHRHLIEDALREVDFSALAGREGNGRDR